MELHVLNVNEALVEGLNWLRASGVREDSRNGPVIVSPEPVMTVYRFPMERLLFSPKRDANPFFHLFESLWMLAGRNDLEFPLFFNSKFGGFSDNGKTVHGAYGYRWRHALGFDQLEMIAAELRNNPKSRRCVLQMWDGQWDGQDDLRIAINGYPHHLPYNHHDSHPEPILKPSKDVPCNTHVYFEAKDGLLNQTVCCRSNDIIWGAYGANAVHFSVLLEYMAAKSGLGVGVYRQFSNNYHLYPALYQKEGQNVNEAMEALALDADIHDLYKLTTVHSNPIINTPIASWEKDLARWFSDPMGGQPLYNDPFFEGCAIPMYQAWFVRKHKQGTGLAELNRMKHGAGYDDWYKACYNWIERREARKGPSACGDCGRVECTCHRVI